MKEKSKTNRGLLISAAVLVIAVLLLGASAQAAPQLGKAIIKVGGQDICSGMNADYGRQMIMGAQLAIDEINAAGGILGSKLEMKFMDTELDAAVALKNAKYMVEEWGADFLFGHSAEGGVDAICPFLPKWGVLLMVCHSGSPRLTEDTVFKHKPGGDHLFRITMPFYQDALLSALYFKDRPDIKKIANMAADYEYGWYVGDLFKESLAKHRPDIKYVGHAAAGYGTADFTSHLAALMAKKPNLIISTPWAGEAVSVLRQGVVAGLYEADWFKVWFQCMGGSIDVAEGITDDVKAGKFHGKLWGTARYLWNQTDRPENVKFVSDFRKRFAGRYPNYSAAATYTAMYALKQALEKTKTLDAKALIKAFEGMTVQGPEGPRWFRPEDHQACYTVPLGRYTFDAKVADVAFLTDFSDIPWKEYYRFPPKFVTP
jgi:branched-chain amino acid transport system substrate-binding protein